ncbi:Hpt domain-containing protein [bacterium RCC_150]
MRRHRSTAAPTGAGRPLPALDQRALQRLARDMHSHEAAEQFAAAYTRMLAARVERIDQALSSGDDHQAMDAVLSLKTSSAMVGALRMEQHCARLEQALASINHSAAAAAGEEVKAHRPELEQALGVSVANPPRPGANSCKGTEPGPLFFALQARNTGPARRS